MTEREQIAELYQAISVIPVRLRYEHALQLREVGLSRTELNHQHETRVKDIYV
jgi:hypothetical protein